MRAKSFSSFVLLFDPGSMMEKIRILDVYTGSATLVALFGYFHFPKQMVATRKSQLVFSDAFILRSSERLSLIKSGSI
jgi:hypothetical protein